MAIAPVVLYIDFNFHHSPSSLEIGEDMSHKESHHGINALIQQSSSRATKNMDASLSHCPQCSCHLDKEGVSEHSFDCRLSSRVPSVQPQALFSHRHQEKRNPSHACLRLSFDYSNVQQIHCKRLQPYQRHLNLNSMQLLGRIVFMLTVFLSFCDVSFAHVTLPWDSWSIEDTTASETSLDHHILDSMMKVPDLVAVAGHLFKYQIPTAPSEDTRTVYYQVYIVLNCVHNSILYVSSCIGEQCCMIVRNLCINSP